jgi:hypothetical protein
MADDRKIKFIKKIYKIHYKKKIINEKQAQKFQFKTKNKYIYHKK